MRAFVFAAAAAATLVAAVPASAQVYLGADPSGAGVEIGPFGFGVGPRYGWRDDWRDRREWRDDYAYAPCRVVRERIRTPGGRVVIRSRRDCD